MNECSGYVYILSNPAMPGIYKIGRSKHGGRVRAREIYKQGGTGVPAPYKMEFELWSEDCINMELTVHDELENQRINQDREFFRIELSEAIETVMRVFGYDFELIIGNWYSTIQINNIRSISKAVTLFEEKTGEKINPPDIEAAITNFLSPETICKALEMNKESINLTMDAMKKVSALGIAL